jgi:hypothetical protein
MHRIPIFIAVFLGVQICHLPPHAAGQTIPSPYRFIQDRQEAEVFVGVANQDSGRFGFGPQPGTVFGARYGIHLGGPFGLEGVVGYSPTTRDVVDPTRDQEDWVVGEADANLISIDARLRFSLTGDRTWRGLNPHFLVGGGVVWDMAGESQVDELVLPEDQFEFGTQFLALFGGGIRWFATDRLMIRSDLGLSMYRLKTPRGYLSTERNFEKVEEKEWVSGPVFSISAGFHF